MNAIPTEYAGIRFRSRLEATWAAFFDLLRWPWEYEPFDLGGYIPDFILKHWNGWYTIVEVKPEISVEKLAPHTQKIVKSGAKHSALVLGVGPVVWDDSLCIGHGACYYPAEINDPDPEGFYEPCEPEGVRFDVCQSCSAIYADPINCENCFLCGRHCDYGAPFKDIDEQLVLSLWATAKNRTQWKGEFGS